MKKLFFQLLILVALFLCNQVFAGGTLRVYVQGANGRYLDDFRIKIYEWKARHCSFETEGSNRNVEGIAYAVIDKLEYFQNYHLQVCKKIPNGYLQQSFDIRFKGPQDTLTMKISEFEFSPSCDAPDILATDRKNLSGTF